MDLKSIGRVPRDGSSDFVQRIVLEEVGISKVPTLLKQ